MLNFKVFGILGLLTAFLLGSSAFGAWLRDEAIDKCNLEWKVKIDDANQALHNLIAAKDGKIKKLEDLLAEQDRTATLTALAASRELETQRANFALSDDCKRCRIPNARIWVRRSTPANTN